MPTADSIGQMRAGMHIRSAVHLFLFVVCTIIAGEMWRKLEAYIYMAPANVHLGNHISPPASSLDYAAL